MQKEFIRLIKGLGIADEGGCWLWQGARNESGYGVIRSDNGTTLAHRWAYKLLKGPLEDHELVCHACDTPTCINPAHLFKGSHKDNRADAMDKGRLVKRLSLDDLNDIKRRLEQGEKQADIARAYGVSRPTISYIKTGSRKLTKI